MKCKICNFQNKKDVAYIKSLPVSNYFSNNIKKRKSISLRFLSHDTHIDKVNINSIDKKYIVESINKSKNSINDEYKTWIYVNKQWINGNEC